MPNFKRHYIPNSIVFITGVTDHRQPYLASDDDLHLFWRTLRNVREIHPFGLLAYVILPDHFHWLMRVDDESGDFSRVLHSIKRNSTLNHKKAHRIEASFSLWQGRFWDHVIRDENDLKRYFDYIHWNPVKHGYVTCPEQWPQSTFVHWAERGYYPGGWGHVGAPVSIDRMDFE